jgi:hypothetical protein
VDPRHEINKRFWVSNSETWACLRTFFVSSIRDLIRFNLYPFARGPCVISQIHAVGRWATSSLTPATARYSSGLMPSAVLSLPMVSNGETRNAGPLAMLMPAGAR